MVYKVAIVDDCLNDTKKLCDQLNQYDNNIDFDIVTYDGSNVELLINTEFDLYFLDISMPNINGIDIALAIENKQNSPKLIFCSNREDLVFDTYKVDTFFFLRKSKFKEDFSDAMKKFMLVMKKNNRFYQVNDQFILFKDILYIESKHNYISIHTNKIVIEQRCSIKKVIDQFIENDFYEVYRGVVVNMLWIKNLSVNEDSLILKNGKELYISARKLKDTKEAYCNFILKD